MKWFIVPLGVLVLLTGYTPPVYSWGSATHAYIAARLEKKEKLQANVIYGQMAADTFNFMFDAPKEQREYLYAMTHGLTDYGLDTVFSVLDEAETNTERAVALGFVTHNNVNGADVTAHGVPYNSPNAYVIAKATQLKIILEDILITYGIYISEDILLEVAHNFVEYASDLLIRQYDRDIGARMVSAAITRDEGFPVLLSDAYAKDFAGEFFVEVPEKEAKKLATEIIHNEEAKFRQLIINYGTILQYEDQMAHDEVVNFLVEIAPAFLGTYTVEIPPGMLPLFVQTGIDIALELCKNDLRDEVDKTIENLQDVDWWAYSEM